uniref:SH2 domain-containing protein n=1 Tax=Globodera pallida TaxID=36090 RepID=A0A183BNS8_GLOPA
MQRCLARHFDVAWLLAIANSQHIIAINALYISDPACSWQCMDTRLLGKGIQMPAAHDLYEWLHVLRPDGRPKKFHFSTVFFRLVEASTAGRFIIYTPVPRRFQQRFNEENALTQERLALASRNGSALFHPTRSTNALMLRCPLDFDGHT